MQEIEQVVNAAHEVLDKVADNSEDDETIVDTNRARSSASRIIKEYVYSDVKTKRLGATGRVRLIRTRLIRRSL